MFDVSIICKLLIEVETNSIILEPSGTNSVFSLQMQLEETENNERRDKKIIREQLEYQVSNLNKELEDERQLKREFSDKLKKSERKLKEMNNQQDELLKKIEDVQVCREQKISYFQNKLFCDL